MTNMETHKSGNYEPIFALVKDIENNEEFSEKDLGSYKYEVIGGQHNTLAAKRLSQKYPDAPELQGRWGRIYVGLTDIQCLWLGGRHNETGEFHHSSTWIDQVFIVCKPSKLDLTLYVQATIIEIG